MNQHEGAWRIDGRRCEPLDIRLVDDVRDEAQQSFNSLLFWIGMLVAFVAVCVLAAMGWLPGGV